MKTFKYAFVRSVPIMAGYIVLGLGFGVLLQSKGYGAGWALAMGGQKLYIAANPAIESQLFYRALGCTDAQEPDEEHMKNAPKDRQLEYVL